MFRAFLAGLILSLAQASHAELVGLVYDEATDGDISVDSPAFVLQFGINSIAGIHTAGSSSELDDQDDFDFTLPAGGMLVAASYGHSNLTAEPTTTDFFTFPFTGY